MEQEVKRFMEEYLLEFRRLRKDYIGRRDYERLIEKYKNITSLLEEYKNVLSFATYHNLKRISSLSYSDIELYNQHFIKQKLIEYKDYFDTLFSRYGEDIYLDEEQRCAILSDDDYSLIIAGAGSGKTTTMAAKVKYLVDIKKIDAKQIVVLSYTKKAVNELRNRITQVFGIDANIMTFHSLALQFINQFIPSIYRIYEEKDQKQIILNYVKEVLFPDKEKMKLITRIFPDTFSKGFLENYEKFSTFEEYFEDYKKRKYEQEKDHIHSYIQRRMEVLLSLDKPMGLDLNNYKSKMEAKIANFLYIYSIDYKYERPYFEKVGNNQIYRPDFTCFLHGKEVYLEYFGMTKYHDMGLFTKEEIISYNQTKEKKIEHFKEKKDIYITIERENKDDQLILLELRKRLKEIGFELQRRTDTELFEQLINEYPEAEFFKFTKKLLDVINQIKETSFITEQFLQEFHNFLEKEFKDPIERQNKVLESQILLEAYQYYNNTLKRENAIDFSDMIMKAYQVLKTNSDPSGFSYSYLLVDEYQDISKKRFLLTKEIANACGAKIVAVGDDWQTIYTFAGSNIELFYHFKKYFPTTNAYSITKTYRNSQELIDTAGEFILKNKEQIPKSLISDKHFENPIEIVPYNDTFITETDALCILLDNLKDTLKGKRLAILTRRNATIRQIKKDPRFKEGPNNSIYYLENQDLNIEILTMHSAKGTTFDEVIILDLKNDIFPTTGYSKSALTDFIEQRDIHEHYPYAEERRLFYVALTRTKNKVYLLTPLKMEKRCTFIMEIENSKNVITKECIE